MTDAPDGERETAAPRPLPSAVDVIVVGSGVAGLSAALELARLDSGLELLLLTRGELGGHGASPLAQGGVAAAVDPADSPALHAFDTRTAGAGLSRPELVEILTSEGPERVRELIRMGARFDRADGGGLALGLEGAHSRHRILHAQGDRTGAEVTRALRDAVRMSVGVRIAEQLEVRELLLDTSGTAAGVVAQDAEGRLHRIRSRATILATGGAGRVYLRTTSPPGLQGDGIAMAFRAGARVRDMEFMQFHPTALNVATDPLPLITEALRGAGARLVDGKGDPVLASGDIDELASRDLVARALWQRIHEGIPVFLDAVEALGSSFPERFPGAWYLCRQHGIDPRTEPIPVTPAAHYHMGGIAVDRDGRTSVRGLWAVGEVAASGVHGANRLASNSLLEGLVFGPLAARSAAEGSGSDPLPSLDRPAAGRQEGEGTDAAPEARLPEAIVLEIRTRLWDQVGVVRSGDSMAAALRALDALEDAWAGRTAPHARNLLLVARLLTRAALLRQESRGSHYRTDAPAAAPGPPRHTSLGLDPATGAFREELEAVEVDGVPAPTPHAPA